MQGPKRMLALTLAVNNLSSLDEDVSKNLMALKNYGGDVETDFGLTFSIMEDGKRPTDLCEAGCANAVI